MKLLTATSQTQDHRDSDFNWCVEGELVTHATMICDRDREERPDGGCGCGRSFNGLNSHNGTTTAAVREIAGFTFEDLAEAVHSYRAQAGWAGRKAARERKHSRAMAAALGELAAAHPADTVLERRLGVVQARETSAAGETRA